MGLATSHQATSHHSNIGWNLFRMPHRRSSMSPILSVALCTHCTGRLRADHVLESRGDQVRRLLRITVNAGKSGCQLLGLFHLSHDFENALTIFWTVPRVLGIKVVAGGAQNHVGLTIDTMLATASMSSLNCLAIPAHDQPASFAVLLDSGSDLMGDPQVEISISATSDSSGGIACTSLFDFFARNNGSPWCQFSQGQYWLRIHHSLHLCGTSHSFQGINSMRSRRTSSESGAHITEWHEFGCFHFCCYTVSWGTWALFFDT